MIEQIAGVWVEEVGGVVVMSAKKTSVVKAVNKLTKPVVLGTTQSKSYNGWIVNTYQFSYFYKADIFDDSGRLCMSYTQKTKVLLSDLVMGYLKHKGVLS